MSKIYLKCLAITKSFFNFSFMSIGDEEYFLEEVLNVETLLK